MDENITTISPEPVATEPVVEISETSPVQEQVVTVPRSPEPVAGSPASPSQAPVVPAPPKPRTSLKWILLVIGILVIAAVLISAAFYLLDKDTRGVTVIRMEGTMVTGNIDDGDTVGSEAVGRQLREAADDPLVEAIVLRVNSPGGTPSAAQEIIGDLEYAKTKKAVVVSMGDIGTSAAYYVSAHADRIYANPDTFTAGVGVIWQFSDISDWMQNEGYNVSVVKSGSKKDMGSTARPLTTEEEAYARKVVDDSFETFISDVTSERAIARSDIEDGRVIRGADAIKMNIIDELGNLNDAIDGAKKMAESRS
jgi:protease-4